MAIGLLIYPPMVLQGAICKWLPGADTMLDVMANGSNTVTITMADEPFDNADVIELMEVCDPDWAAACTC
jgi:hypothetical protein